LRQNYILPQWFAFGHIISVPKLKIAEIAIFFKFHQIEGFPQASGGVTFGHIYPPAVQRGKNGKRVPFLRVFPSLRGVANGSQGLGFQRVKNGNWGFL